MQQKASARHEVIMVGSGGRGVLMIGELLARSGMSKYKHVVYFPSYGFAMRGGLSECTVILSDDEIASPILSSSEVVVIMESGRIKSSQGMVRPGGLLVMEAAGAEGEDIRKDVTVLRIPAIKTALGLGNTQVANLVLLGAYIEATKVTPPELIESELEKKFAGREEVRSLNRKAFREGMALVEQKG